VSRSQDNTMKLWDVRNTRSAVKVWENLENSNVGSKVCLSPDEKYILTGTTYDRETEKPGTLKIFDSTTFD
jgi:WD repeat-containing protein 70